MRRPTRSPFHPSDLGGPFVAFAPRLRDDDEELSSESDANHPLFTPTRHQRSSVLSLLIDALRSLRVNEAAANPPVGKDER